MKTEDFQIHGHLRNRSLIWRASVKVISHPAALSFISLTDDCACGLATADGVANRGTEATVSPSLRENLGAKWAQNPGILSANRGVHGE